MTDIYEMNGLVRVQGRPGNKSPDGENWCYDVKLLVNTSSPVCDLSITTEDTGSAGFVPGFVALNPDINPETPEDDDVMPGIRVEVGTVDSSGAYSKDDQQVTVARGKIDGDEVDKTESADELKLLFTPCIARGKVLRLMLCFDEELDEDDFINFLPSFDRADGVSPLSGDVKPSTALTTAELIKALAGIAGAAASLGKRMPNKRKRQVASAAFTADPKLARLAAATLANTGSAADMRAVLKSVPREVLVRSLGTSDIVNALGDEALVTLVGSDRLARAVTAAGMAEDLSARLG